MCVRDDDDYDDDHLLPLAAGLPACWEHKRTGGQPVRRLGLLDLRRRSSEKVGRLFQLYNTVTPPRQLGRGSHHLLTKYICVSEVTYMRVCLEQEREI